MLWVEIIVKSKKEFDEAIRAGAYTALIESEAPVKIHCGNATLYFPGGVCVYQLRKLCARLPGPYDG